VSDFDELYKEIVLDHYRNPRNKGTLPVPPATATEGFNPLCGDELTLYLDYADDVIVDIKITGHGCSIFQASASMMTVAVKGKGRTEVDQVIAMFKNLLTVGNPADTSPPNLRALGEMAALSGVVKFPARIKCATLAWNTLVQALEN
jgi:nitrogen fixation protein NifU and related proteins